MESRSVETDMVKIIANRQNSDHRQTCLKIQNRLRAGANTTDVDVKIVSRFFSSRRHTLHFTYFQRQIFHNVG